MSGSHPKQRKRHRKYGNKQHRENQWLIFYANAQGLKGKIPCLRDILTEKLPQVALFTETMLNDMSSIKIQGYTFCGKSREEVGGGVGIFVRNDTMDHVTPHESSRDLEIYWISVRRKNQRPLYIGVYYGKQESRVRNDDIDIEFGELTEEILELKREGDIILCTDANAKIGMLGEPVSRNGKHLLKMIDEIPLVNMNSSQKCKGKVTRINRKNSAEKSAIDFVLTCQDAEELIKTIDIDEDKEYVMKNEKAISDHNSFFINLDINDIDEHHIPQRSIFKTTASDTQWESFTDRLHEFERESKSIMRNSNIPINERYSQVYNKITKIAEATIGKTVTGNARPEKFSEEVKSLRAEKRQLKKMISTEQNDQKKDQLKQKYYEIQKQTRDKIQEERDEETKRQFRKMIEDKSRTAFWKLIKNGNRKPPSSWVAIKDKNGKRITDPQKYKERSAEYYKDLFSMQPLEHHPYHDHVATSIKIFENDFSHDEHESNICPTLAEIKQAIQNKKNGKSTTDIPNELLKNGGEEMAKIIHHVVEAFWNEEILPDIWNEGLITSLFKGKGDREKMDCQRGITVSSAISMIPEEIIHNRMRSLISLTPFQGGGKKNTATRDHVFMLRAAISTALHKKRPLFLTFYDVKKAYDHANPEDMLYVAWQSGLKGKLWRLTKLLNTNLTARVNTRHGKSDKFEREIGGKQGGKIMTFLFAKLMDTLVEDMRDRPDLGIDINGVEVDVLEWVDDVISFAESHSQQIETLNFINEFAKKHRLEWGPDKCKVIQIGKKNDPNEEWRLGENIITSAKTYTYLGDIINENGTNQENLENRKNRVQGSTRRVLASAKIDVLKTIETKSLLQLHEAYTVSSILINCESWVLTKTDRDKLDKMELWAYKKIFNVPITTPTAAVIYETRSLFTSILVIKKQLQFLHHTLSHDGENVYKKTLESLISDNIGWGKYILKVLRECELDFTLEEIKNKKKNEWKQIVHDATWELNRKKILDSCQGKGKIKTKTQKIPQWLELNDYKSGYVNNVMFELPRNTVKIIIMARYGMLDCANNYRGKYGTKLCRACDMVDDEDHRMNNCVRWKDVNLHGRNYSIDFGAVYSSDIKTLEQMAGLLKRIWNLDFGKNEMRSCTS